MITPSTSTWGLAIMSGMSLQVPGSDSSALTTRYFGFGLSCGMNDHFMPVGKPAPPLPPGGAPPPAAAAETGVLDRGDDRVGRHAERGLERAVAAAVGVGRQ